MHELITNAVKYGALSLPEGHVTIRWATVPKADGEWLLLDWFEAGGPTVSTGQPRLRQRAARPRAQPRLERQDHHGLCSGGPARPDRGVVADATRVRMNGMSAAPTAQRVVNQCRSGTPRRQTAASPTARSATPDDERQRGGSAEEKGGNADRKNDGGNDGDPNVNASKGARRGGRRELVVDAGEEQADPTDQAR